MPDQRTYTINIEVNEGASTPSLSTVLCEIADRVEAGVSDGSIVVNGRNLATFEIHQANS